MGSIDRPPLGTAEVIAVGSELLGTTRLDTNSLFLAGRLGDLGVELRAKSVVGDDRIRLRDVFLGALSRADLVILTGGLGPTDDDLTREVVSDALGLPMSEQASIVAQLEARFARRGLRMPDVNRRQAMVPQGAQVLDNPNGTAPGLMIEHDARVVVLLPGPPRELQPMFDALCRTSLATRTGQSKIYRETLFVAGRGESHVEELAQPIYSRWTKESPPIETTILAMPGQVELHLLAPIGLGRGRREASRRSRRTGRGARPRHLQHRRAIHGRSGRRSASGARLHDQRRRIMHRRPLDDAPHRRARELCLCARRRGDVQQSTEDSPRGRPGALDRSARGGERAGRGRAG